MTKTKFITTIVIISIMLLLIMVRPGHTQLLQITSPANGSLVSPGQTLTIVVSATGIGPIAVFTESPLPPVQSTTLPTQFTLSLPPGIRAGTYHLTAEGILNGNEVSSVPVAIDIEPLGLSSMR